MGGAAGPEALSAREGAAPPAAGPDPATAAAVWRAWSRPGLRQAQGDDRERSDAVASPGTNVAPFYEASSGPHPYRW